MTASAVLATTVTGDGPRRALLIHGLTSAGSTWWRTAEALAADGYTVTAPDLRGHGSSPKVGSLSIESHRDDILALGGGWDLIIGHSLGGAVAAAVLAAEPAFAKRVILEDPAIDSDVTDWFLEQSPPIVNPTVDLVAAEHPEWEPLDVELKVEALLACGPGVVHQTMRDASPWDLWPEIIAFDLPALIIAADPELGTLVSVEKAAQVDSTRPVRVMRIDGAGHSMHRDAFDRFIDLVRAFGDM